MQIQNFQHQLIVLRVTLENTALLDQLVYLEIELQDMFAQEELQLVTQVQLLVLMVQILLILINLVNVQQVIDDLQLATILFLEMMVPIKIWRHNQFVNLVLLEIIETLLEL